MNSLLLLNYIKHQSISSFYELCMDHHDEMRALLKLPPSQFRMICKDLGWYKGEASRFGPRSLVRELSNTELAELIKRHYNGESKFFRENAPSPFKTHWCTNPSVASQTRSLLGEARIRKYRFSADDVIRLFKRKKWKQINQAPQRLQGYIYNHPEVRDALKQFLGIRKNKVSMKPFDFNQSLSKAMKKGHSQVIEKRKIERRFGKEASEIFSSLVSFAKNKESGIWDYPDSKIVEFIKTFGLQFSHLYNAIPVYGFFKSRYIEGNIKGSMLEKQKCDAVLSKFLQSGKWTIDNDPYEEAHESAAA